MTVMSKAIKVVNIIQLVNTKHGIVTYKVDLQGLLARPHFYSESLCLEVTLLLVEPIVLVKSQMKKRKHSAGLLFQISHV